MQENQFDTIYHEHFSYFSFFVVEKVFERHGLIIFDVEEWETHGGSLRIYAQHADNTTRPASDRVRELRCRELALDSIAWKAYAGFGEGVRETKRKLLEFLIEAKRARKHVVGYGRPGRAIRC